MRIKGFDKDLKCRGFQFEIGKEYKIDLNGRKMKLCSDTVFHYCDSLEKVHEFYNCLDDTNRFCEIEVLGEEITDEKKCGSNHIKIIREITGDELDRLKGYINGNVGLFNSGYRNSGDCNSGDCNSGYRNSGDYNSGYYNSGYRNSGYYNSGYYNSGYRNSGDCNSGYYNSGYRNSGDYNSCNNSNGVFCNTEDKNIRIFNKPSGMSLKEFRTSKYYAALVSEPLMLTEWVYYSDEEKSQDKDKELIGGYLKEYEYKEACQNWWNALTDKNREIIQEIPNFDKEIFFDITGIEIKEDE